MSTHVLEQTLQISLEHLCVPVHANDALEFDLGLHTHDDHVFGDTASCTIIAWDIYF